MGVAGTLGTAASLSLLAGWRLSASVRVAGIAMRAAPLPGHPSALSALGTQPVSGIAAIGTLAEFPAGMLALIDSLRDMVHSIARLTGGALPAPANLVRSDPAVGATFLPGGAAVLTHAAKAGTRAAVIMSPEPVSNLAVSHIAVSSIAVSSGDRAVAGDPAPAVSDPRLALGPVPILPAAGVAVVPAMRRLMRLLSGGGLR